MKTSISFSPFSILLACALLLVISLPAGALAARDAADGGNAERADSAMLRSLDELRAKAQAGDARALFNLAEVTATGYGPVQKDSAEALRLYRLSADKGYAPAQNYMGFLCYSPTSPTRDPQLALQWIEKAAGQGDPKAFNNLGWLLLEGEGVEHDAKKAAYWFGRAAEAGLPVAMAQLGDLYRQGKGVECDTIRARNLYDSAIAGGLADAQYKLLSMMYPRYREMSPEERVDLGRYYLSMNAPMVAVTLFELSAAQDNAAALALMGNAYSRGEGVPYSHLRSLEYYLRAARMGNAPAQFVVGELLELFPDSLKDLDPSFTAGMTPEQFTGSYWREAAASQGVDSAEAATARLLGF